MASPRLRAGRVDLRPFAPADAGFIDACAADLRVARMTSWPFPSRAGAGAKFVAGVNTALNKDQTWAIDGSRLLNRPVIGCVNLRADGELGFWLGPDHWGNGFATESAQAVLDHGFASGLPLIWGQCMVDNPASARIMEKLGMTRAGSAPPVFSPARAEDVDQLRFERHNG